MTEIDPAAVRGRYEEMLGDWPDYLDPVLAAAPEVTAAFVEFRRVPVAAGLMPPKYRELILLAVNASATHLHVPAIRYHIANAGRAGASRAEILEVLEMTSVIGMHTCSTGLPILYEELQKAGIAFETTLDARRQAVKDAFIAARGWWSDFLEQMVMFQPDLLEAYVAFSSIPWKRGLIPAKVKELIYIAIDSQTTHLYESGLRSHIQNALKQGASPAEIAEVFALISGLGFHTLTVAVPELDRLA